MNNLAGLVAVLWQCLTFGAAAAPVAPSGPPLPRTQAVCSTATNNAAACEAKVRADKSGGVKPFATFKALPAGYSPSQLRTAYGINTQGNSRIAVITAYDSPNAKKDLDNYNSTFGLGSFPNCTNSAQTACFSKTNQYGGNFYPSRNRSWAMEADLDVQIAHAICPGCRLTLVEASSSYLSDLTSAVDQAVNSGAKVVSMSWGADEFSSEGLYDYHFSHPGVQFVAASGDNGYGTGWPAAASNVLSAGGTHLELDATGQRTSNPESVWAGTGSGCSLYEAKPTWQKDTGCATRTLNDAAAVADPYTGAAVYSSYSPYGSGWFIIGGTSLSTPLLGGIVADAPAPASQSAFFNSLYGATTGLNDVTSGSNGVCTPAYFCTAGSGYDGPAGLGTPNGLAAF
jgi:subtilase family serine protease